MEKSWAEVAKVLRTPTRRGDRHSDDARMEAYLTLNELVEEPDTTTRMDAITHVLPHLVRGFHMDLLESTGDVLPMCLRALSYFMYHEHIASLFSLEMVQTTIDRIIHVVHNTSDQTVYLLCLWSLSKQNFDEPTHQLVPRLIDVFCLACINELQSRKIQLHALFGLHTILLKHPTAVLSREVLKKWCHVVAKGLASSDKSIRDASRKIFQEMAKLQPNTVESTHDIVEWCMEYHAVPAMHGHMAGDRPLEAIHVWGFVVVLLRAKLSHDDELLNSTFKVPEVTLRHPDSRVRVASLQHWRSVVDIFRSSPKVSDGVAADTAALWLFRNAIVDVVMRPLTVCFREEHLATVLSTACDTWHHLVGVAVADLNAFCRRVAPLTMDKCKLVMRSSWKLWWEDMVTQVLVVLMHRIDRTHDTIFVVLRDRTHALVRRIWQVDGQEESETYDEERDDKQASAVGRSLESLSISNTPLPPSMTTTTTAAVECLPVQDKSVAMLVMLQSALHCISSLLAPENDPSQDNKTVVVALWHGLVSRLQFALMVQPTGTEDAEIRKLHRRLMTKCWTLMLGCTQFQAKSAASLRDPDTAAAGGGEVAFGHRVDLLEHVLANLDLRCSEDVILESGGQLQQALAQKAAAIMEGCRRHDPPSNDETKDDAGSDLQWLRQDIFTDACVASVFGMVGYTLVLDLAVYMEATPWSPPLGLESIDVAVLTSVATILDKLAGFNGVPPELRQVLVNVVHVLRSMAQAKAPPHLAAASGEKVEAIGSIARDFHTRWAAQTHSHDDPSTAPWNQDKAESASPSTGSLPSPCLLQKGATLSSDHRRKSRPDHVSPPTPAPVQPATGPIRPDLVDCKEPFALIKHHFPQSFRQLSGFFNIQTIGDLCAKSEADIAAMSLHDPVNTVHKALDEFVGRRARLNTLANKSPMKRKLPLTMYSPNRTLTTTTPAGSRSPKRRMKSAMRSLTDEVMRDDATAKVADVVKFSVLRPDGSVRVIRPGEDSQSVDPDDAVVADTTRRPGRSPDDETPRRDGDTPLDNDAKLISLASKVVSHLERCDVYVEKIKAHVHSGRATHQSPGRPTACWTVDERTKISAALVEANGIMAKMARDIGQLMEPSAQSSSSLEMSGSGASWTKPSVGP